MASLDSLPADQKAVLSLVLQRGRTFDEIAALLSIDRAAVRQRALEGFDALGPETTLDPLKRALITDYLLGQLPAPVAANVRNSIAKNPPERAWARVIAAEVGPLAVNGLPEVPSSVAAAEPEPQRESAAPTPAPVRHDEPQTNPFGAAPAAAAANPFGSDAPTATGSAPASESPRSSRRGGAILLGLVALVVIVVIVVLLVAGGGSKHKASTSSQTTAQSSTTATSTTSTGTSTAATPLHQINMTSPTSVKGREGAADVVRAAGQLGLVLVAEGLVANAKNAYGVWLYDSKSGASHFLGFYSQKVTSTGSSKGQLEAEVKLPAGATKYNELLLTLETAEKPTKPGTIVLEGAFAE